VRGGIILGKRWVLTRRATIELQGRDKMMDNKVQGAVYLSGEGIGNSQAWEGIMGL